MPCAPARVRTDVQKVLHRQGHRHPLRSWCPPRRGRHVPCERRGRSGTRCSTHGHARTRPRRTVPRAFPPRADAAVVVDDGATANDSAHGPMCACLAALTRPEPARFRVTRRAATRRDVSRIRARLSVGTRSHSGRAHDSPWTGPALDTSRSGTLHGISQPQRLHLTTHATGSSSSISVTREGNHASEPPRKRM